MNEEKMVVKGNTLYFAKIRESAKIPTKKEEDAGYDIYTDSDMPIVIFPNKTELVPTGIACAVSPDYYLQVEERGSIGSKGLKKSAGIIDSGYRGEIFIALTNTTDKTFVIAPFPESAESICKAMRIAKYEILPASKAIAQLIVHRVEKMDVQKISYEKLKEIPSERGIGALGSSGK